ncbi:hypothetical protein OU787_01430 [Kitasatospora sp. YST-16]|uniref:hypothetical protein n=1 Tax=Kitasatospora sp. YST-16 TaxID=2998080 RepID=UPI0022835B88|nr:hypothetical protein [Kitasatospora sp. YST-16]WAL70268.1 hypothetical protein OU787_01430 [Kitasatospora sp. YST-16]WNW36310.1 hypothetical protein RKE32_01445 [Streptomyces sp. Li-HN-5-13]
MSDTTTRAAWPELLEGRGGDCEGSTPADLADLGGTGPEAISWYAFCAADFTAQLAGAARAALARWAAGQR